MDNFKILIVEDNPGFALEVEILVKETGYELIGVVDNSEDALDLARNNSPDLIIMDIDIKGKKNGVEVAKELKSEMIPVIFMTSIKDPATFEDAKNALSYAYIVKPFDQLTLQSAIEVAVHRLSEYRAAPVPNKKEWQEDLIVKNNFLIKTKGVLKKVNSADVLYIESDWNYCKLITKDKKYMVKMALKKILELLGTDQFVPIHKSFIVQFEKIDAINVAINKVHLGDVELPLGRTYKDELLKRYQMFK